MCGAAFGAQKLNVEKKGTYIYWFSYVDGLGKDQVTQPVKLKGQSGDLDVTPLGTTFKKARLFVMNKKTGNMAILDYAAPKDPKAAKPIEVKDDAFTYVRTVRLKAIAEDGSPLESAVVEITDGDGTDMRAIVTPADGGVAAFENVATGEISVKVRAKGVAKTVDSDIELPSKRDTPGFEKDIKVTGDVDTLQVAKAGSREGKAPSEPEKAGGGISAALQTLAGLILVIVVIAIVYVVLKSKGVTTEQALKSLGVQLPGDQADVGAAPGAPPSPAVDPNVCQFCGQRKDANGNCACSVPSGPISQPLTPSPQGVPRLVGIQGTYMGQVFEIPSGSKVMGREAECDIALVNDTTSSRRHATITVMGSDYSIRDEGSSNGTFVNGARITEQKLMPGDEVQVGGTRFKFEV